MDIQVGDSSGILAGISDSLLLRNAANDTYDVYVALDPANPLDATVQFEAEARVQYDPDVIPIRPLLPDLQFRPQSMVTFDTPVFPFFGDVADPGDSCYHLEKSEDGAQTCLRFQQEAANDGEGALELRFAIPKNPNDTSHNVFQRTFFSDDPVSHYQDTLAGTWEFHAAHQHYHYNNFAQSNLLAADSRGQPMGPAPVRTGRKVSFCIEDEVLDPNKWGEAGVGPRTYHAPDCLFTAFSDANFNYLIQGITKGWADIYEWYLPGQYIEVTEVPDGDYVLETIVDPDDKILESDDNNDRNNCGSVLVRLSNMGTPQRHAEIIGPGPACRNQ
jgi:Lysyl oxidase